MSIGMTIIGSGEFCRRRISRAAELTLGSQLFERADEIASPCHSESGLAPGRRFAKNLIWPLWFDSCSQTWNHLQ